VFGGEPHLTNCIFSGNSASNGGGIYRWNPAYLTNCTFSSNTATGNGGGMYNYQNYTCLLTNCTFNSNFAQMYGGGVYNNDNSSPELTNCIFNKNESQLSGGGIANYNNSHPIVTNCTFSGNVTVSGGGGGMRSWDSSPIVKNCILWGNSPDEISSGGTGSPDVYYSDVQNGTGQTWFGDGCIDADPCFVDADANNLRLLSDSPCIDAGDNSAVPSGITTDLDGHSRFIDDPATVDTGSGTPPIVDMGAYEYFIVIPPPPQSSAVNFENLAIICANWLAATEAEL
jgi:parallel beta-helix repeat protein